MELAYDIEGYAGLEPAAALQTIIEATSWDEDPTTRGPDLERHKRRIAHKLFDDKLGADVIEKAFAAAPEKTLWCGAVSHAEYHAGDAVANAKEQADYIAKRKATEGRFERFADWTEDLIPLIPPGAPLYARSAVAPDMVGKVPGYQLDDGTWCGFVGFTEHHATTEQLPVWEAMGAGVGLIGRHVIGIDVDVTDPVLADAIGTLATEMLGSAPKRTGNAPKFLMPYRVDWNCVKRKLAFENVGAVELLGSRQHFVIDGIHPKTGKPYTWEGTLADAPSVTAERVDAFMDAVEALAVSQGHAIKQRPTASAKAASGAPAPAGFVEDMPRNISRAIAYLKQKAPAVEGDGGNDLTMNVARTCGDMGASEAAALDLMCQHWNPRCLPPWDDTELESLIGRAYRSRTDAIGREAVGTDWIEKLGLPRADPVAEWMHAEEAPEERPFILYDWDAIRAWPAPEVLVEKFLMVGELAAITGMPKTGKSFVALDAALCVATGKKVFGALAVNKSGPVVYLSGEGHNGMPRRIGAWRQDHNISHSQFVPFFYHKGVPNAAGGIPEAMHFINGIKKYMGVAPVLVVIDTLARSLGGLDENTNAAAAVYLALAEEIRSEFGCTVLTISHTDKHGLQAGIKGSGGFDAGMDAIWKTDANKDTGTTQLNATFLKDAEDLGPHCFRMERVTVKDMEGAGVVLRYVAPPDVKQEARDARYNATCMASDIKRALTVGRAPDGRPAGTSHGWGWKKEELAAVLVDRPEPAQGSEEYSTWSVEFNLWAARVKNFHDTAVKAKKKSPDVPHIIDSLGALLPPISGKSKAPVWHWFINEPEKPEF